MEENVVKQENKEMKLCKYCQSEIPKKAKICPNCRKKQGGKGKWIIIGIVVVFILIGMSGGNDENNNTAQKTGEVENETIVDTTKETSTASNKAEEPVQEEQKNEFVVGDVVETNEFRISYLSAGEHTSSNEYMKPAEGKVYYRMEFEFENISDSDQTISSLLNWACYADGYAADQAYMVEDDEIDATLSAGRKAKGSVYFEIPVDATEIVLEYETNFLTENKVIFVVK